MTRYLVSHPHAGACASAVACALDERGALAGYETGVAAARGTWRGAVLSMMAKLQPEVLNRAVGVDPGRLRTRWSVEVLARIAARMGIPGGRRSTYDALFLFHDAVVASMPWPDTDAVYAYEDGALRTFRRARARGKACVWDLPLPHWATLERMWREESARWPGAMGASPPVEPEWKRRRKEEELALADAVSVASRFTRESLDEVGCRKPVVEAAYGFPVDAFRAKAPRAVGPLTVLAVGTQDLRKGTPYLLEAWRRAGIPDARLRVVGPLRLTEAFVRPFRPLFEHVPHLPRAALESEYHAADLLAFPTLGDGFGLVMQEAMCCATPVLTTRCGGGPECIRDGVEGWIAPERDVDALVDRLRWAADHRDALVEMGRAARRRAEALPWRVAGDRLVAELQRVA